LWQNHPNQLPRQDFLTEILEENDASLKEENDSLKEKTTFLKEGIPKMNEIREAN
jgi:hypothetical protein